MGSKVKYLNFAMSQLVGNIFTEISHAHRGTINMKHIKPRRVSHPRLGSKGQNSFFSEHGHVAYRINGDHECSSMVVNILLADPIRPPHPLTLGFGSKGQNSFFSEHRHVAYQIKKQCECSKWYQIFSRIPPPPLQHTPSGWGQ